MTRRFGMFVALGFFILFSLPGLAAAQDNDAPDELPPFLLELRVSGAEVRFLGEDYGIYSWLATKDGQVQFFYSIPDGDAVISGGLLVGPDGEAITARRIVDLNAKKPEMAEKIRKESATSQAAEEDISSKNTPGERLYTDAEGAQWFSLGSDKAPPLYIFVDTQCKNCHRYWNELAAPFVEEGNLQVRLIPVAVTNEKSEPEAAALLMSVDPATAWQNHVDGNSSLLSGSDKNEIALEAVRRNTEIFRDWKLKSTPYSVYRDSAGKVKVMRGMKPGVTADIVVKDLTGQEG